MKKITKFSRGTLTDQIAELEGLYKAARVLSGTSYTSATTATPDWSKSTLSLGGKTLEEWEQIEKERDELKKYIETKMKEFLNETK